MMARHCLGKLLVGFAACLFWLGAPSCGWAEDTLPDRLEGHGGPIKAIVLSRDGSQALTTSFDYSAIHWSLAGGRATILHRLFGHEAAVNDIAFIDAATAASVSDDGSLILWDLNQGRMRNRVIGTGDKILDIAVAPDRKTLAFASWDQTVRVHDTRTGALVATMRGHRGNVNAVRYSLDGKFLYSASYDGTMRAWDSATGEFKSRIADHGWAVNVMELLPDGRLVYGLLDGTVLAIDPVTGEPSAELMKHQGPVLSLAASPSGRLIASGGGDGRILVSSAETGAVMEELENPYGPVWSLAFSSQETAVLYAGLDDFVTVWKIAPRKSFEPVLNVFPRRFQVSADVELGEREFARKCSVCHTLEKNGKFRAGPTLFGLFGRKVGTLPGYPYSQALLQADFVWNAETIDKLFSLGPHEFTPGTKMPLQKIQSKERRDALIAYLRRVTDPNYQPDDPDTAPAVRPGPADEEQQETKQ